MVQMILYGKSKLFYIPKLIQFYFNKIAVCLMVKVNSTTMQFWRVKVDASIKLPLCTLKSGSTRRGVLASEGAGIQWGRDTEDEDCDTMSGACCAIVMGRCKYGKCMLALVDKVQLKEKNAHHHNQLKDKDTGKKSISLCEETIQTLTLKKGKINLMMKSRRMHMKNLNFLCIPYRPNFLLWTHLSLGKEGSSNILLIAR